MKAAAKIVDRAKAGDLVRAAQRAKRVVGFTSGTFDLLHPGHVEYLEQARSECDLLVVGVNSDRSVHSYKSPGRPVCGEEARIRVIAALESVDLAFLFDDRNNNKNIELLRPDIYFKAGDYTIEQLSSAPLVASYGGAVIIIPAISGYSSTAIIERIEHTSHPAFAPAEPIAEVQRAPAVFLDRDGTINVHREYLHEPKEFEIIPGALEAMKQLREAGYRLVIVTNQPGIGLGYFTKEDLFRVNRELLTQATKAGVDIDKLYYCPHSKSERCACRKPATGMIDRAVRELNIDLSKSVVVGDMTSDVLLGKNAGCAAVLVQSGRGGEDKLFEVQADFIADSLGSAAQWILSRK